MKTLKRHRITLFTILLCCAGLITCSSNKTKSRNSNRQGIMNSKQMNEAAELAKQLEQKGISDQLVLKAIATVPRHEFVNEEIRSAAYLDRPLPIQKGQTISQPYTVAYQSELLQIEPGDKVLEIGTGSGYQAAILCEMGANVFSIERFEELYLSAKKTLNSLGYFPNLFYGDGYEGLSEIAPFDKILVTAAPEEVPQKLLYQLRIGGWMVVPIGGRQGQKMTIIKRTGEESFEESEHGDFIFVPMKKGVEK